MTTHTIPFHVVTQKHTSDNKITYCRPTWQICDTHMHRKYLICCEWLFHSKYWSVFSQHLWGNTKISYLGSKKLAGPRLPDHGLCPWTLLGAQHQNPQYIPPMLAVSPKLGCLDKTKTDVLPRKTKNIPLPRLTNASVLSSINQELQ